MIKSPCKHNINICSLCISNYLSEKGWKVVDKYGDMWMSPYISPWWGSGVATLELAYGFQILYGKPSFWQRIKIFFSGVLK